MKYFQTWVSNRSRLDWWWSLGFLSAAVLLFCIDLGGVALRDWDEGTVAQVAKEIMSAPNSSGWWHPTLWGEPYFNKPPLVHGLISLMYQIGGINEWTARLPGALLTTSSVPLLYGIGRQLFPVRLPAIMATMVYLTLLPVVRHGRLAMLDGAVVCFFLMLVFAMLRSRRDLRWALGVGLSFSLICLAKSIVGLLLLALALGFIAWDTPRLLTSLYFWLGLTIGSIPMLVWYIAQYLHYGQTWIEVSLFSQSLARVSEAVETNSGPPWYYLLELLKYSWPWLFFLPWGLRQVWRDRNLSWAKLMITWLVGYLGIISVMGTKLPWYVFPVYPAIALVVGVIFANAWQGLGGLRLHPYTYKPVPVAWSLWLLFLMVICIAGLIYLNGLNTDSDGMTTNKWAALVLILTFGSSGVLLQCREALSIPLLGWGMYLALLLFVTSNDWVWELNEDYPVKPVASLIQQVVPTEAPVYTSHNIGRPSLNFYSDRLIIPQSAPGLVNLWQTNQQPYFLIKPDVQQSLQLDQTTILGQAEGWLLVTRQADVSEPKT